VHVQVAGSEVEVEVEGVVVVVVVDSVWVQMQAGRTARE